MLDQNALNNRANQLNPNNDAYYQSRGRVGRSGSEAGPCEVKAVSQWKPLKKAARLKG